MDCTFKTPEGKFNLRVGAVITDGKRVLVSKDGSHLSLIHISEPTRP